MEPELYSIMSGNSQDFWNDLEQKKARGSYPENYYKNFFKSAYDRFRFYSVKNKGSKLMSMNLEEVVPCDGCNTSILKVGQLHECVVCQKPICSQCNEGGFCKSHYQDLSTEEQKIVKDHAEIGIKNYALYFLSGLLGVPFFFAIPFVIIATGNVIWLAPLLITAIFFVVALPFILIGLKHSKAKKLENQVSLIIGRFVPREKMERLHRGLLARESSKSHQHAAKNRGNSLICELCGEITDKSSKFCKGCGTELPEL